MIAIAGLLGFCGVTFELLFAQSLTVLFGQTAVQYALAIGLFLAGMGLGAHLFAMVQDAKETLWRLQISLAGLVPLGLLIGWWLAVEGWPLSARLFTCVFCFIVGVLTGSEIPLLFRLHASRERILCADYFGMLGACALFPLVLLPFAGIFRTLFLTAAINALVAIYLRPDRRWALALPSCLAAVFFLEPGLREWLSLKLIAG